MHLEPKRSSYSRRTNAKLLPPADLVAGKVDFTMVPSAEGDGELIADPAAKGAALGKAQVVGVRG